MLNISYQAHQSCQCHPWFCEYLSCKKALMFLVLQWSEINYVFHNLPVVIYETHDHSGKHINHPRCGPSIGCICDFQSNSLKGMCFHESYILEERDVLLQTLKQPFHVTRQRSMPICYGQWCQMVAGMWFWGIWITFSVLVLLLSTEDSCPISRPQRCVGTLYMSQPPPDWACPLSNRPLLTGHCVWCSFGPGLWSLPIPQLSSCPCIQVCVQQDFAVLVVFVPCQTWCLCHWWSLRSSMYCITESEYPVKSCSILNLPSAELAPELPMLFV